MTFKELVERARNRDRGLLVARIAALKAEGYEVFPEPALRNASGKIVDAPDGLQLPLRVDLAFHRSDSEVKTEYTESRTIAFREPVLANWGQLKVEIRSIAWAELVVKLSPVRESDWEGVRQWFFRWFDSEDKNKADAQGLTGVVHFISDPKFSENEVMFDVDLGSSSIASIGELFDEFDKLGFEKCVLGQQAAPENFVV